MLRIIGRKSVSQLTLSTTVIMIAVGAIFVQPINVDTVPRTLIVIAVFVTILLIMEYLQLKINVIEKIIHGKAVIVIENGQLVPDNLQSLRITVDKLESQLRQQGITRVSDVKIGTIEPNGQFGYELMPDAKPLTVGEFKRLMGGMLPIQQNPPLKPADNIFEELTDKQNINHTKKFK
ncbi:DUF421 domain-containing protein [Desulfuribacillus alkaliarsenatis]|nr:YetF domain-containing protein [Desulfuribacillus alkaliarsenatis]